MRSEDETKRRSTERMVGKEANDDSRELDISTSRRAGRSSDSICRSGQKSEIAFSLRRLLSTCETRACLPLAPSVMTLTALHHIISRLNQVSRSKDEHAEKIVTTAPPQNIK